MTYDIELRDILEKEIISSLLNHSELFFTKKHSLKSNDFNSPQHQLIYSAIIKSIDEFNSVSLSTVREYVKDLSEDGLSTNDVIKLMSSNKSFKGKYFDKHCEMLFEYNTCDTLEDIAQEIISYDKKDIDNFQSRVDSWKTELSSIGHNVSADKSLTDSVNEALAVILAKMDSKQSVLGVTTGVVSVDDFTSGWLPPDLILFAARPGMGKSAYAIDNFLANGMKEEPAAFFSYEMPNQQILERQAASLAKVNSKKMLKGQLSSEELVKIQSAFQRISELPLHLIDKPLPLSQLINKIRYLRLKFGIKIAYIDYVQLIENDLDKTSNEDIRIGGISRRLKLLCMELDMPIVLLSQLSRGVETRGGLKKPVLSDLRGSGSLEQDADIINFFFRPSYYGTRMNGYLNEGKNLCIMIMAKGRRVGTTEFDLFYKLEYNYFEDWDNSHVKHNFYDEEN